MIMQERLLKNMLVCSILFSAAAMAVMLHFSATKTIVIAEEAAPEHMEDAREHTASQNQLQFQADKSVQGLEIPLPQELRADDIVIENRYIENGIHVVLKGKYSDFYRTRILLGNGNLIKGGSLSEENGKTRLQLEMRGLYEHQYVFENGMLQLSFAKPSELYSKIAVLDAVHGGAEAGNVGEGITEKKLALEIVELVREKLKDTDIRLYCTRTDDVTVPDDERIRFANELEADMLISIGAGADAGNHKVFGIQTFYNSTYFIPYFGNISLADVLERNTVTAVGGKANGLFEAGMDEVLLQGLHMPAAKIEVGYLTNKEEAGRLSVPEYKEKLAEGIAAAIQSAFAELEQNP